MSFANKVWTVQEYLIAIGLRQKNQRGRLSDKCIRMVDLAIEAGYEFSNWDSEQKRVVKVQAPKAPAAPKPSQNKYQPQRGATKMVVVSQDGTVTTLEQHPRCGKSISFCTCKQVDAPAWLKPVEVKLVR